MRFRTFVATCAAASLSVLATSASAEGVVFDSLGGVTSSAAFAGGIDPVISATFNTGTAPARVDVALLLRDRFPEYGEPSDTLTVSLDGGIPLSDLSFDPIGGLDYTNGSSVDFQGPAIESVTFAVTGLPTAWTVEHYDQFAGVALDPNSLYWIEVSVHSASDQSVIEWGMTADTSGPGVASNYLAWSFTDDGFFRNKGVDPFPFDSALQMEVDAVPEPSTWAMMLVGFAGLGFAGWRRSRTTASAA
ncbi:MAG TPA: PEP-CTERM sorting domain-containing protein [Roseiarcus sp.]